MKSVATMIIQIPMLLVTIVAGTTIKTTNFNSLEISAIFCWDTQRERERKKGGTRC